MGAHDGTMGLEQYLPTLTQREGVGAFVAAGNEGNKSKHMSGMFPAGQTGSVEEIEFFVAEGDLELCPRPDVHLHHVTSGIYH